MANNYYKTNYNIPLIDDDNFKTTHVFNEQIQKMINYLEHAEKIIGPNNEKSKEFLSYVESEVKKLSWFTDEQIKKINSAKEEAAKKGTNYDIDILVLEKMEFSRSVNQKFNSFVFDTSRGYGVFIPKKKTSLNNEKLGPEAEDKIGYFFSDSLLWISDNTKPSRPSNTEVEQKNSIEGKEKLLKELEYNQKILTMRKELFSFAISLNTSEIETKQKNHLITKSFLLNIDYFTELLVFKISSGDTNKKNNLESTRSSFIDSLYALEKNNPVNQRVKILIDYKDIKDKKLFENDKKDIIKDYENGFKTNCSNLILSISKLCVDNKYEENNKIEDIKKNEEKSFKKNV